MWTIGPAASNNDVIFDYDDEPRSPMVNVLLYSLKYSRTGFNDFHENSSLELTTYVCMHITFVCHALCSL